ncbi:MAG: hypothetical protein KAQ63_00870 [Candidatus Moranbacteria bacterium]|nr:hypothetical protein [Candidatus Moranbacteria bacterium]
MMENFDVDNKSEETLKREAYLNEREEKLKREGYLEGKDLELTEEESDLIKQRIERKFNWLEKKISLEDYDKFAKQIFGELEEYYAVKEILKRKAD